MTLSKSVREERVGVERSAQPGPVACGQAIPVKPSCALEIFSSVPASTAPDASSYTPLVVITRNVLDTDYHYPLGAKII